MNDVDLHRGHPWMPAERRVVPLIGNETPCGTKPDRRSCAFLCARGHREFSARAWHERADHDATIPASGSQPEGMP